MVRLILATWIAASAPAARPGGGPAQPLRVYLPRERTVEAGQLRLGSVCVLHGTPDQLVRRAEQVVLGRGPLCGEEMIVDRAMIAGRLAAGGIPAGRVEFLGAEQTRVRRREQEVERGNLVAAAADLLDKSLPAGPTGRWRLAGRIDPVFVPGDGAVEVRAADVRKVPGGRARVEVELLRGGRIVATRQLLFERLHAWRRAVTKRAVERGTILTEKEVAVEVVYLRRPQPAWTPPYGRQLAGSLPTGAVVAESMTVAPRSAVVVRRDQVVSMRVELGGFVALARGRALEDGRVGELIKVQNVDSRRIIAGRVRPDGVVEPALQEK